MESLPVRAFLGRCSCYWKCQEVQLSLVLVYYVHVNSFAILMLGHLKLVVYFFFAKWLMFFLSEIRQFGLIPGLSGVLKSVFSFGIVQDEAPNLRKISKLAEYASKNPMRIPKIASALEQKGQKELQNKHHGSVRAVMATYSKLFMTCRDEMYVVVLTLICCLISVSKLSHLCCSQHKADDFWKSPGVPPTYSHWIC
jgi:hypothetical protein